MKKRLKKIMAVGIVLTFVCGCGNGIKTTSPFASPDDKMAEFVFSEDGKKVAAVKNGDTARYAIIPDGVTSIGSEAFWNCGKITSITLPEGLKEIDDRAFSDCIGLTSITVPQSVTSIEKHSFQGCYLQAENITNSSELDLTDYGLTIIDSDKDRFCIRGNELVKFRDMDLDYGASITIPEGVTSIGNFAFEDCIRMTNITIPEGVTSIGYGAFSGCEDLESVTIPDSVESIGDCAFEGVPHIEYHGSAIKEPWGADSMN